ncbi:MAG: cysteine synthase A [Duncaniella sp.]|uniref:cysteine synthase A n=1 Tax=Duncaniella sp. TaxID=2518496 RepID=UPI0023D3F0BF|nr:cysteine synthase A [Duncaniella sp.]MDE5988485.1 cysteine synthase A [Duncaniella sp.]
MNRISDSILETVGATPLLRLNNYDRSESTAATIYAKIESFNPGGSVKDRVALNMIMEAEESGQLKKGGTIIEPTSGNTGIGLALVGAARGYNVILTMPETMSVERRKLVAALGARVVLTSGAAGMKGAIAEAERLKAEIPGAVILGQFVNPANPQIHYRTTGPEIWSALDGKVDCFVAGVGTGGTVTGIGSYLKEQKPDVEVVAVEPADSPVLSGGSPGPHKLQGIGAGFVPEILDRSIINKVVKVEAEEAYGAARRLARTEGVLCGISSGAALHVATVLAKDPANAGKNIVVLLPDTGERYLSTDLFAE